MKFHKFYKWCKTSATFLLMMSCFYSWTHGAEQEEDRMNSLFDNYLL